MNIEQLYQYCHSKKAVTEHFPFDENTLVFKVAGKMFLLTSIKNWETGTPAINLKCDPDYAQELRAQYESVQPGYHMNKTHWNTVSLYKDLPSALIPKLIDHSYNLIIESLPKKVRNTLQ
ncbi:MmcQ/YjbR family DNA-binding protein [Mangrovimonas cancribranchiae]|uniref:MmcQ/YjbR family DNA-binding protein n=1 Tax=Mangrovimonas cancribranchiae TaxID=3080055 RepID=A0AAU6P873_9FLAO